MLDRTRITMYSGGHKGAEAEFGRAARHWGIAAVTLSFPGQQVDSSVGARVLTDAELAQGDVSMEIVSKRMGRTYHSAEKVRRVVQSLFHMVNSAYHVFAIGWIQSDDTVKGGTGWGVELAKLFNRPVSVFDQDREQWYSWKHGQWVPDEPLIPEKPFAASGTRNLTEAGREAIHDLFERSLGPA